MNVEKIEPTRNGTVDAVLYFESGGKDFGDQGKP
jgi:hypothetical protein